MYGIGDSTSDDFGVSLNDQFQLIHSGFTQIYFGCGYFFFKHASNELHCVGSNSSGALGLGNDNTSNDIDTEIEFVSNGIFSRHTFIKTNKNKLYAFGLNNYDQLSIGNTSNSKFNPVQINMDSFNGDNKVCIAEICCG